MNKLVCATLMALVVPLAAAGGDQRTLVKPRTASALLMPGKGWAKTWGGSGSDAAHNAVVDGSGNVYVAGGFAGAVDFDPGSGVDTHTANGGQDVFLAKFASDGAFRWARTWGGSGRDVANGVAVDGLGTVYVAGPFQSTVDFDPDPTGTDIHSSNAGSANNVFLSKFDANGNLAWVRTWGPPDGGAEAYSVSADGSNNVYVVGDFSGTTTNFNPWDAQHPDWHTNHPPSSGPILFDSYLSKFDANGSFLWARTWGGEGYDDGPGVAADGLGNVYVAGMYASQNINFDPAGGAAGAGHPAQDSGIVVDVFLSKFDANGVFQWVRTWGGQGTDDVAESVAVDGSNSVYVAGRFASTSCDFDPWGTPDIHSSQGSLDAFVSKFDGSGTFQWARTWGGPGWDAAGSATTDGSNNVYVTGTFAGTVSFDPEGTVTLTSNGGEDVFFSAFDAGGTLQWTKTWGGSGDDEGYHVALDGTSGASYAVGSFEGTVDLDPGSGVDTHTSNGGSDAFLGQFLLLPPAPTGFVPLTPCRVLDTRNSMGPNAAAPILAPSSRRVFTAVGGACGVPSEAIAISVNVTIVGASAQGDLKVVPGQLTDTITSTISVPIARARANNAIVRLSNDGSGTIAAVNSTAGTVHFILDVNGYFR